MKPEVCLTRFRSPLIALVALSAMAGPGVLAQEKPRLDPEVIAILGEPDPPQNALDADVIAVLGRPEGTVPSDENGVNLRATAIGSKLRCPVCQGVAISDSPAGMAVKMRGQVRDLVAQGYSEEQVMLYFERSYGEFVRLEPPMRGLNVMLWLLPLAALAGGAFLVLKKSREPLKARPGSGTAATAHDDDDDIVVPKAPELDTALARYLERVRRDSGTST